jgi:hypothetical protein
VRLGTYGSSRDGCRWMRAGWRLREGHLAGLLMVFSKDVEGTAKGWNRGLVGEGYVVDGCLPEGRHGRAFRFSPTSAVPSAPRGRMRAAGSDMEGTDRQQRGRIVHCDRTSSGEVVG